jgi:hypothetical protein
MVLPGQPLGFLPGRTRRQPSIVVLDHFSITIGSVAVTKRAGAVIAKLCLEPSREFDLQLTQRIDHIVLEQRKLRRVSKRIWIEAAQLLDGLIEVLCEIAVASKCAFQFFSLREALSKLAFELSLSRDGRSPAGSRIKFAAV